MISDDDGHDVRDRFRSSGMRQTRYTAITCAPASFMRNNGFQRDTSRFVT
ncbi:hypothetical protein DF196_01460 [Bifidobacterium callitrichidarum]|uniref:Chitin synthase N-terminal domain-containing protein n=1 Tax=Bifidobacterium callitrichidarum TaxID=2052941 RepID=A0A2U2NCP0_9BIFI|nr:hypothetical protein DF196_01460 [Bifidobacterium callitrichidarum]